MHTFVSVLISLSTYLYIKDLELTPIFLIPGFILIFTLCVFIDPFSDTQKPGSYYPSAFTYWFALPAQSTVNATILVLI